MVCYSRVGQAPGIKGRIREVGEKLARGFERLVVGRLWDGCGRGVGRLWERCGTIVGEVWGVGMTPACMAQWTIGRLDEQAPG